jgi:hypothetical protein
LPAAAVAVAGAVVVVPIALCAFLLPDDVAVNWGLAIALLPPFAAYWLSGKLPPQHDTGWWR